MRLVHRWLALFILPLALPVGCATSATATPEPSLDPLPLLRRSVSRMLALESVAFTLEHQEGTTALFPGLEMHQISGVVDIPDRFSLTVEAEFSFPRSFVEIEIAVAGDQAYMTDIVTGKWQQVTVDALPFSFTNLERTLADIIKAVEAPTLVGTERLSSYTAHRIKGRIHSEDLGALVPKAGEGFPLILGERYWPSHPPSSGPLEYPAKVSSMSAPKR